VSSTVLGKTHYYSVMVSATFELTPRSDRLEVKNKNREAKIDML